jgi:peptide/nickel transport system substrate-binding protein
MCAAIDDHRSQCRVARASRRANEHGLATSKSSVTTLPRVPLESGRRRVTEVRRKRVYASAVLALAVTCAAVLAAAVSAKPSVGAASAGGTYRVGWESDFGFTNGFDPTGEYLGEAFAIFSNLTTRTLLGYNHVAGPAGNLPVPDIAAMPKVSNGGKTYTFKLKSGIKFSPPINREVTSADVAYAFQRMSNPKNGAQYGFYYSVIKGFDQAKGKKISGISTPDSHTIVFNLTAATGDFVLRVAMPAAGPIPPEFGKCFEGKPGLYGRSLVSTGPYMIAGMDKVSTSCKSVKPASGFDGKTKLDLVRNPSYAASTDSRVARENLPDEFLFTVDANADDIYNKIASGELDDEIATEPPKVLRKYLTSSSLRKNIHQNSGDRTSYVTMNLTQPPFDDVHIRKAMNWITDKDGMRKIVGGVAAGGIATHIAPDTLFNGRTKGYDPYRTPGQRGSLAKAKAEIKKSRYDSDKDGICDADACKDVLMITDTRGVDPGLTAILQSSAKKVGITFEVRPVQGAYPTIQTPSKNVPIAERPSWGKDYADPLTFFGPLFDGRIIIPAGNTNYSLVGVTPKTAKAVGATGTLTNVPSIDRDLDRCAGKLGAARTDCYVRVDHKLMEVVVPWIPWFWPYSTSVTSSKVTKWVFDQFSGSIAYAHVAVK